MTYEYKVTTTEEDAPLSGTERVKELRDVLEQVCFEPISYSNWGDDNSVEWQLRWSKHDDNPALRVCYDGYEFSVEIRDDETGEWHSIYGYLK